MSSLPPIVGTINAVQGKAFVAPAEPPNTYLGMARALHAGIEPLASAGKAAAVPLAFVAAQVAECALKAYLSRSGKDELLRKPPLNHNLELLWERAQSEMLPVSRPPPKWLSDLSALHSAPYFIRYSTGVHGLVLPAVEPMATELTALVALVEQLV